MIHIHKIYHQLFAITNKGICILLFLLTIFSSSCKKFIEIATPSTSTNSTVVYSTDANAIAVVTDLYRNLSASSRFAQGGLTTLSFYAGLSSDELILWNGTQNTATAYLYYKNTLASNLAGHEFWNISYPLIFTCNSVIEGLSSATKLTPAIQKQLLGETKFMRAFFYYYLVNLYGDVPLVLTTDYKINSTLPRANVDEVYRQIISDLTEAQNLLSDNYLDGTLSKVTTERVRPTKAAATALLARVYLYTKNWIKAEEQSSFVINNKVAYDTVSLNNVFLKNSKESIWQLQPVYTGWNTEDAKTFIITSLGPNSSNPFYLSNFLLSSFETGDKRSSQWVKSITVNGSTYNFPYKYKVNAQNSPVSEYLMILRLSEQYLIRAEAKIQQNKITEGLADLNVIRKRAGLLDVSGSDISTLVKVIIHERQVELFTELGHRWLDLKRVNQVDAIMNIATQAKGGIWTATSQLYPLPLSDIQKNPALIQNKGY